MAADALDVTLDQTLDAAASAPGADPSMTVTREQPGRYTPPGPDRADNELGRGGIGRVLVVRDAHLSREVALKELLSRPAAGSAGSGRDALVLTRFLREARITGQLEHPGIVPVYELGQRPDGTLYYTMKVVRGRTRTTALPTAVSSVTCSFSAVVSRSKEETGKSTSTTLEMAAARAMSAPSTSMPVT